MVSELSIIFIITPNPSPPMVIVHAVRILLECILVNNALVYSKENTLTGIQVSSLLLGLD